jgi:ATP-binding protein involved in chromosome partitioning
MLSHEGVLEALSKVMVPELGRDLVSLAMAKDVKVEGSTVSLRVDLPTPSPLVKEAIASGIDAALKARFGAAFAKAEVIWNLHIRSSRPVLTEGDFLPTVKNVILVGSGKGGVGKSTVSVNLACALQRLGAKVGILDADIYGPSIPTMFGTHEKPAMAPGAKKLTPIDANGVKLMSIGFLVDPNEAVVWRGPMLASAVQQLMRDVDWPELDYLVIDLPPGTGDVQLTLSQVLKVSGAVVVTTPQTVALADVVRAKSMFDKVHIPVIGLVENMAGFVCDNCDKHHSIFDRGGGERAAAGMDIPFLGEVPLVTGVREAGDAGLPIVAAAPDAASSKAFLALAASVATKVALLASRQTSLRIVA